MIEKVNKYQHVNRMQNSRLPKLAYLYMILKDKVVAKSVLSTSEYQNRIVALNP
jgi:hypothetical protein